MTKTKSKAAPGHQAADASSPTSDRLLTETQAADFLSVTIRALQAWRQRGGGPRFAKIGRLVRYRMADLTAWLDANTRSHTSDPGPAG